MQRGSCRLDASTERPAAPQPFRHLFAWDRDREVGGCGSDSRLAVSYRGTLVLTLVLQLESWPVLGVVAVEVHDAVVGRGEQGARQLTPAEPAHHAAGLGGAAPDF